MATDTAARTPANVADALDRVHGQWHESDPDVLAFPGDGMPVVAAVHGELRYLSYHVVDARPVSRPTVTALVQDRGGPHVIRLSTHPAGYGKRLFER